MSLPALLFVTNLQNSDPEEDMFLSGYLGATFALTVANPEEAVSLLPHFSRCLIRNAWPSRLFVEAFHKMRRVAEERWVKVYNPFHRIGYVEDKTYLMELFRQGYPVIPTVDTLTELSTLPSTDRYIIKPKDGCSSWGVRSLSREETRDVKLEGWILQPEIDLKDEVSFYFLDDGFLYAMVSVGKHRRWELKEYVPSSEDVAWARRFVAWNALPYGLQRIDACRTKTGELLLMEIESQMPMLTLFDLSEERREEVLGRFTQSLVRHLG